MSKAHENSARYENSAKMDVLRPMMSVVSQSDRAIRRLRILLLVLMLTEVIAVLVPRISNLWRGEIGFLPQILIGFVVLALIFTLHLAAQRRLLRDVSTALIAATSYVENLEQFSCIDPQTRLFNRSYLVQLFDQQMKWLNRHGKPLTLWLTEVLPDRQKAALGEIVAEAAYVLRSNFRGSDYIVRYGEDQFLVVLPDTNEWQAQVALQRLTDRVDAWNLENATWEMGLRHELSTCLPGGNLWEKLHEIEARMRYKPEAGLLPTLPAQKQGREGGPADKSLMM
jgi:diguanylate cyclase (GGDEF)-like protein